MTRIIRLQEPEARQGFSDVDKFGDLYQHLPERLRTISLFLYTTGCRSGEAKKLRWDQVDWAARVIRVEGLQTKNKTARTIPLAGSVYDRLQTVPEANRAGLLFPVGCFRKAWQSAGVKAGLGTLTKGPQTEDMEPTRVYRSTISGDLRFEICASKGLVKGLR